MSMDRCQYCGKGYDQDYEVEHEEECFSNPATELDDENEVEVNNKESIIL